MNTLIVYTLLPLAYLVTPAALIFGWVRWSKQRAAAAEGVTVSLVSFAFTSGSAALGLATIAFAQIHYFGFYDPVLMRIYGCGAVLSCISLLLSLAGFLRPNVLRWYAPACALGTLAFWVMTAAGE
ncbi:hypothetical protein [Terriglobus roseus]|uniref:hypothetical protein n=1 Tax=Terriglobus roseus TaxID=392734 RepID=UPI001BAF4C97|nr:hypothetical protein [Terriglobus roseus]